MAEDRPGNSKERTYKSILFEVMPEAIASERAPSGRLDVRGLFYACRRLYNNHPDRPRAREAYYAERKKGPENPLEFSYFKNRITVEYQQEVEEIEGLDRKAMSDVYQSHTADDDWRKIATSFVEDFDPPEYYYDKVLFVEKRGVAEDLAEAGLGEAWDLAIIASPGFGSEADRNLLRLLAEEGYQILVLHDLDVNGFAILANIQDGNHRVGGVGTEIVDLGLRLEDIPDLDRRVRGLSGARFAGEDATRQKALPDTILKYLTPAELRLLTGSRRNQKVWDYKRYELNEIPAEMRVAFVEGKLEAAGLRKKVIPPEGYLGDSAVEMVEDDIEVEAGLAIDRVLADAIKEDMVERFRDRYDLGDLLGHIERGLKAKPRSSWRSVLRERISAQGVELRGEIEASVRGYLPDNDSE
jgi:Topoisomerase 6 subunit A/Spo11, Toprim domain